ncbi:hypothetical protein GOV04_01465 [Candidatus Woesearchaeota archaeon]|nr:hypothetical protein [Candidatus Woesearchaeota archaeon]
MTTDYYEYETFEDVDEAHDMYYDDYVEHELEADSVSGWEAAFMHGYNRDIAIL